MVLFNSAVNLYGLFWICRFQNLGPMKQIVYIRFRIGFSFRDQNSRDSGMLIIFKNILLEGIWYEKNILLEGIWYEKRLYENNCEILRNFHENRYKIR